MAKQKNIRVRRVTEKAKVVKDYGTGIYAYKKGQEIEFNSSMRAKLEKLGVISKSKSEAKEEKAEDDKKK